MGITSTHFLSYHEIKTEGIDLYEDAFGLYQQFDDVIGYLKQVKPVPEKSLTRRLIGRIRKH
ncbi:MAG TPA: hypothetical protein DDW27_02855 [Bacteroidales bacterium]|nr:hypothetical protein [Bacteroidales bacterium]